MKFTLLLLAIALCILNVTAGGWGGWNDKKFGYGKKSIGWKGGWGKKWKRDVSYGGSTGTSAYGMKEEAKQTYSAPAPVMEESKPSGYSAPAPSYQKPAYSAPAVEVSRPASYSAPAPSYQKPAYAAPVKEESRPAGYSAPAPSYQKPAYTAPVEVKSRGYEKQTHQAKSVYGGSSY